MPGVTFSVENKEENPLLAYELGFSLRKNKED